MHADVVSIIDEQTNFPTCPLSWIIQQEKDVVKAHCQSVLFVIHLEAFVNKECVQVVRYIAVVV